MSIKRKALFALVVTPLTLIAAVVIAILFLRQSAQSRWQEAEEFLRTREGSLVAAAETLIASSAVGPGGIVTVADVPASLRIPHLRFAQVFDSHVNLILDSSPDLASGFRVWVTSRPSDYDDEPTGVTNVQRFRFCDDYPESPSNRL